ncbi:MAG: hypothetical protein WB780_00470 [Candidatus Acidiferrales bacterium]
MLVNYKLGTKSIGNEAVERERTDYSLAAYQQFLQDKVRSALEKDKGLQFLPGDIHPSLKPHQVDSVLWAVRGGRRAIFEAFGLGKTRIQLEILRLILSHDAGFGLIVAPLGVRSEFFREAAALGITIQFIRRWEATQQDFLYPDSPRIFITNYETVRDGKLDPSLFTVATLDEAAVLRGLGPVKTYREFMQRFQPVKYRFVATATPDPNDYIELLAYSSYLGIMAVSHAKTRFFKRDSTKADHLTLHPHKEQEFWMWVSSWALFLQRPSDLGYSDEGYALPPLRVFYHEVSAPVSERRQGFERNGQTKMFRDALASVTDAARAKRETLTARVGKMKAILAAEPEKHFLLWHDLESEREAIEQSVPDAVSVYGAQGTTDEGLAERERAIMAFSDGEIQYLAAKPVMLGSGCNFQRHCSRAIFVGIGHKFKDFIQAVHRIHRFLQTEPVEIHLIYADSERGVLAVKMGRKAIGIELAAPYFLDGCGYVEAEARRESMPTLFDLTGDVAQTARSADCGTLLNPSR